MADHTYLIHIYLLITCYLGAAVILGLLFLLAEWVWNRVFDRLLLTLGVMMHFRFYLIHRITLQKVINVDTRLLNKWEDWSSRWGKTHG
jgi:hypothetical protein